MNFSINLGISGSGSFISGQYIHPGHKDPTWTLSGHNPTTKGFKGAHEDHVGDNCSDPHCANHACNEIVAARLEFLKAILKTIAAPLEFLKTILKTIAAPMEFLKTINHKRK